MRTKIRSGVIAALLAVFAMTGLAQEEPDPRADPVLTPEQQAEHDAEVKKHLGILLDEKNKEMVERQISALGVNGSRAARDALIEYSKAQEIAEGLMKRYMDGEVDKIVLIYNEFKSAIQATPRVKQLLPIATDSFGDADDEDELSGDYIFEPSAEALFSALLPHYVENQVFQAMIESAAAEHGARMTAMDAATKNAGELIENLTLTMNRVRQASITTEIIEVVSGAEALG